MKEPKLFPPDMALAKYGLVKQLYDRIRDRKDMILERAANGKAIYGYRPLIELNGKAQDIESQCIHIEDTAHAIYHSKDSVVYLVSPDIGLHVAEAICNGKSIWSDSRRTLGELVQEVYRLFPRDKATKVVPVENPEQMDTAALELLLARRKLDAKKAELAKYGERLDVSSLPEMTSAQRQAEMLDGRPKSVDEIPDSQITIVNA